MFYPVVLACACAQCGRQRVQERSHLGKPVLADIQDRLLGPLRTQLQRVASARGQCDVDGSPAAGASAFPTGQAGMFEPIDEARDSTRAQTDARRQFAHWDGIARGQVDQRQRIDHVDCRRIGEALAKELARQGQGAKGIIR